MRICGNFSDNVSSNSTCLIEFDFVGDQQPGPGQNAEHKRFVVVFVGSHFNGRKALTLPPVLVLHFFATAKRAKG